MSVCLFITPLGKELYECMFIYNTIRKRIVHKQVIMVNKKSGISTFSKIKICDLDHLTHNLQSNKHYSQGAYVCEIV